jgi:predicted ATP-grasp superfamily ATP-dependent carboligase
MKILIGDVSSYKTIILASFFKRNYPEIEVYTYDYKYFSKFIKTKYSEKHFVINKENIISEISSIVEKNNINLFFPVINSSLKKFWEKKHVFGKALNYLGNFSTFEILNNKKSLHSLAIKLGIKVPKIFSTINDAETPFIVKPTNLSSAEGVKYYFERPKVQIGSPEENLIIQEYVQGFGVGFSFYCKNGEIFNGYGHKRLTEYPISGGSSTYREFYFNDQMYKVSFQIVNYLKYTGFAMFEFKITPKNELYLIEVNPRIWGSINQGLVNGNNYFEQIIGLSKNNKEKFNKNLKTYVTPLVYLSFFQYALNLNFTPLLYFINNLKLNKADISIFNDPLGYLSTILRKLL